MLKEINQIDKKQAQGMKPVTAVLIIAGIICLLLVQFFLSYSSNMMHAKHSADMLLDRVSYILENNDASQANMEAGIKRDYIARARNIARIINMSWTDVRNTAKLRDIASLTDVDEIDILDENGVIIGSTDEAYLGYSLDSGEQIAFFKPMLQDKKLGMCQGLQPNSVKGRYFMYTMVWSPDGSHLVEIGINPERWYASIHGHSLEELISKMPMHAGITVMIVNKSSGRVVGATRKEFNGRTLDELKIAFTADTIHSHQEIGDGNFLVSCQEDGPYQIVVLQDIAVVNEHIIEPIITMLAYVILFLLIAGWVLSRKNKRLEQAQQQRQQLFHTLQSMSDIYEGMHLISLAADEMEEISATGNIRNCLKEGLGAKQQLRQAVEQRISPEHLSAARLFINLDTLDARMKGKKTIYQDFLDIDGIWIRDRFIRIDSGEDGHLSKVMIAVSVVDAEKRQIEKLQAASNTDAMTNCFNRRAYEEDILRIQKMGLGKDMVCGVLDINGLKQVNDNIGHEAGDELIQGAAACIRRVFSPHGWMYRVGGDEFVVLFFATSDKLEALRQDFQNICDDWKGQLVTELSISAGYAAVADFPDYNIHQLAKAADEQMYKAKAAHYARKGFDRRGQQDAHKLICQRYLKIVRADLATGVLKVVNLPEADCANGLPENVYLWLQSPQCLGQIHPDDQRRYLELMDKDFLRQYFLDNSELVLQYRRQSSHGKGYAAALMEILPAQDFSEDNMVVYIYVREIAAS